MQARFKKSLSEIAPITFMFSTVNFLLLIALLFGFPLNTLYLITPVLLTI